jgi:hypothetical protein
MVIASDQCERLPQAEGPVVAGRFLNFVNKIKISPDKKYAWAFSGGRRAKFLSETIQESILRDGSPLTESALEKIVSASQAIADTHWAATRKGPELPPGDCVIIACPESRRIIRYIHDSVAWSKEDVSPRCIAGLEWNQASFMVTKFYCQDAGVNELAVLASYAIRSAHDLDTWAVDGLDLAIFRNSDEGFEWCDAKAYWGKAAQIDTAIGNLLKAHALPSTHL